MPTYDLLGYSNNYYIVSESLQNYRKGEVNDDAKMQMKIMLFIIGYKTRRQQQVDLTTKITGSTPADYNTLATYIVLLMKYLINFCRSPDLPLINWEIELNLSWQKDRIIYEILITAAVAANPDAVTPTPSEPAT